MKDIVFHNYIKEIKGEDMLQNNTANELLYVPFNQEYSASLELQKILTEEEFFEKCYYDPDFNNLIEKISSFENEEGTSLGYPTKITELIKNLENQRDSRNQFYTWIKTNDVGVYCISGTAGTGKSTFLHNLAYHDYEGCIWNFLDLQVASDSINLMSRSIAFPSFHLLQQKLSSTIVSQIIDIIFIKKENKYTYDYETTTKKITNLIKFYYDEFDELYPLKPVRNLFLKLKETKKTNDARLYCEKISIVFQKFFYNLCKDFEDKHNTSGVLMELYLILLKSLNGNKHIIVFDNLERFIGDDEIYNTQVHNFLTKLRSIHDRYNLRFKQNNNKSLFAKHFQFVVAMRTSTSRMVTPQQNGDFAEHLSNVSEWFSIDEILRKRMDWLTQHGFEQNNKKRLKRIVNDKSINEDVIRGLWIKLNGLFNNNKRLILEFLLSVLENNDYKELLEVADGFYDNADLPKRLSKHAYRSLIWRIVIEKLLSDDLFIKHTSAFKNFSLKTSLDYIRKILIVLNNYSCDHPHEYMPMIRLLERLYPNKDNVGDWFNSKGNIQERKQIFHILYFMNYYCRSKNNWFQFVDIQCNNDLLNGIHFDNPEFFYEFFSSKVPLEDINIQITTTGKTYLGYVAHTLEFISSVYVQEIPLMMLFPTEEEILNGNISELPCLKTIQNIFKESSNLCQQIDTFIGLKLESTYKKNREDVGIPYSENIRRAHRGSVNNFCHCISKIYCNSDDKIFNDKKNELINSIRAYSEIV